MVKQKKPIGKTSEEPQAKSSRVQKARSQRHLRKTTQLEPNPPPPPPLVKRVESLVSEREEESVEFVANKFRERKNCEEMVITHKSIAEFQVFYYTSLEQDGLDLFTNFMTIGSYKFCWYSCDY